MMNMELLGTVQFVKTEFVSDKSCTPESSSDTVDALFSGEVKTESISVSALDDGDDLQASNVIHTKVISLPELHKPSHFMKVCKSPNNRVQHYRTAWERNPLFSMWLTRGRNSRRAKCRACNCEMSSDITVLRYHARSKKHMRSMKAIYGEVTAVIECGAEPVRKGFYNQDWEEDIRYSSWIAPGKTPAFAYCKLCRKQIPADSAALRGHLSSYKHMKSAEYDDQIRRISSLESESISIEAAETDDSVLVHEIKHSECQDTAVLEQSFEQLVQPALVVVKDDRHEPLERLSFLIGKFLLKGEKMLNAVCGKCQCVLLEDRKKQTHCVGCQYGLMDEILAPQSANKIKGQSTLVKPWTKSALADHVLFDEEPESDVTEIHISEVTSSSSFADESATLCDTQTEESDCLSLDLRREVEGLVGTLRSRLSFLTDELNAADDIDDCLECLDKTITAISKLKNLANISS
ncbi:uncharacterized protein LOC108665025 [Hyalella azteca]|uniref:Uncharacterized protein LOC108665025 n=1 Tax=Hyalella azteca TaxID=294128 RepID=A0A8B7N1Y1_HYAAZ|nr:uncharacterized protein LOC108665025 [Hyalella azteca]